MKCFSYFDNDKVLLEFIFFIIDFFPQKKGCGFLQISPLSQSHAQQLLSNLAG